jgi:hypothetical protein
VEYSAQGYDEDKERNGGRDLLPGNGVPVTPYHAAHYNEYCLEVVKKTLTLELSGMLGTKKNPRTTRGFAYR